MNFSGYDRREAGGVVFHVCIALEQLAGFRHGFSTRHGPAGLLHLTAISPDADERVRENRRSFQNAVGLPQVRLITVSQVHSDRIVVLSETCSDLDRPQEADALVARQNGIAVGVQVADCFPVLLADPETGAFAAVHSGWRGTAARILRKTVEQMRKVFRTDPASLWVAIGPGIRSCCMQVGPEVAARFEGEYPALNLARPHAGHEHKYLLDIPRALAIQCVEAGIAAARVFDMQACTRCRSDEFFSYRAEGAAAGRMMAVIGRAQ
jgi:hypothetical protein